MKKLISKWWLVIAGIPFVFASCLNSDYTPPDYDQVLTNALNAVDQTQLTKDLVIIDDSLHTKWEYTDVQTETKGKVRFRILELGSGLKPTLTSVITVTYKGFLLSKVTNFPTDPTPFDTSDNIPAKVLQTELYNLIVGWQTALTQLPAGTKARLYIPSGLGYGARDIYNTEGTDIVIPKNSNLIFEIELKSVQ